MSGIIAQNVGRHTGLIKAASAGGEWTLIQTQTASTSATIDFTSGLDSTYDEYCFKFISLHAGTNTAILTMNGSSDSGSNYNVTKTNTYFEFWNRENGSSSGLSYADGHDVAQSTAFFNIQSEYGDDNDMAGVGYLHLFNPSSTTFVKHFTFTGNQYHKDDYCQGTMVAGYFNTTSVIDAVQFKMNTGNIDSGTISLFGIG